MEYENTKKSEQSHQVSTFNNIYLNKWHANTYEIHLAYFHLHGSTLFIMTIIRFLSFVFHWCISKERIFLSIIVLHCFWTPLWHFHSCSLASSIFVGRERERDGAYRFWLCVYSIYTQCLSLICIYIHTTQSQFFKEQPGISQIPSKKQFNILSLDHYWY